MVDRSNKQQTLTQETWFWFCMRVKPRVYKKLKFTSQWGITQLCAWHQHIAGLHSSFLNGPQHTHNTETHSCQPSLRSHTYCKSQTCRRQLCLFTVSCYLRRSLTSMTSSKVLTKQLLQITASFPACIRCLHAE